MLRSSCHLPRALLLSLTLLAPALASASPDERGSIRGRVSYAGRAPERPKVDVQINPEVCGRRGPVLSEELVVSSDGGLAHAAVLLTGVAPQRASKKREVMLEQKNCVFHPHLQTVTAGSTLVITNDDAVVHNVHAKLDNETLFNLGMPLKGTRVKRRLKDLGVSVLHCDSGHTWMLAYLVVVPHPYHATSDASGGFVITEVPPGTYTLRSWHEKLGPRDVEVTVEAGRETALNVTYPAVETLPESLPPLTFAREALAPDAAAPVPATAAPAEDDLEVPPPSETEGREALAATETRRAQRTADVVAGRALYGRHCAPCHGDRGDGRGEAARYLRTRPRDFTRGEFKFRSTRSGELPLEEDLVRTISTGIPGTEMPSWSRVLSPTQRRLLARYVMSFSDRFLHAPPAPRLDIARETPRDAASIARGREVYVRLKCAQCHGPVGRADGVSQSMVDDWGHPIAASDLTRGEYKSGREPRDLYRTLITGLSGTPMPSFLDQIASSETWDLVHYLESLAEDRALSDFLRVP